MRPATWCQNVRDYSCLAASNLNAYTAYFEDAKSVLACLVSSLEYRLKACEFVKSGPYGDPSGPATKLAKAVSAKCGEDFNFNFDDLDPGTK